MGFLDQEPEPQIFTVSDSKSGKGKKQCPNCKNYTGVRKYICDCGFVFAKKESPFHSPESTTNDLVCSDQKEVYCFIGKYSEFAKKVLEFKNVLVNKNFHMDCPPGALRFSLRDCITGYSLYTKNPSEYLVVKCLRLDEFTNSGSEKLLIVEVVKTQTENVDF